MIKKNQNGVWSPHIPVSIHNPEKRDKKDWWDEVCKAHGEKNHWKKKTVSKTKTKTKTKADDEG